MIVIRTIKLQLNHQKGVKEQLLQTMSDYNVAFNSCVEWGFTNQSTNKVNCHHATYFNIRNVVPNLPSALIQSARDCACESLKATKCRVIPHRKKFSAMRYNKRSIRINLKESFSTIATCYGRIKVTFHIPKYYSKYSGWKIVSANLSLNRNNNRFYLHCQVESRAPEQLTEKTVLGIDRGIINTAVCSDNTFFNSRAMKNRRSQYAYIRAQLQAKGTVSARRKLKRMSGKERRFMADVNHCISKQIVQLPYTVFALEDLSKIRVQKRRGKQFNQKLHTWAFHQLEQFLRYKAENVGKQVILVDSRFTSQKCSVCGHIYKGNRKGSQFLCRACGFELHADLNASRNIAQAGISGLSRLSVNQPNVMCF